MTPERTRTTRTTVEDAKTTLDFAKMGHVRRDWFSYENDSALPMSITRASRVTRTRMTRALTRRTNTRKLRNVVANRRRSALPDARGTVTCSRVSPRLRPPRFSAEAPATFRRLLFGVTISILASQLARIVPLMHTT